MQKWVFHPISFCVCHPSIRWKSIGFLATMLLSHTQHTDFTPVQCIFVVCTVVNIKCGEKIYFFFLYILNAHLFIEQNKFNDIFSLSQRVFLNRLRYGMCVWLWYDIILSVKEEKWSGETAWWLISKLFHKTAQVVVCYFVVVFFLSCSLRVYNVPFRWSNQAISVVNALLTMAHIITCHRQFA